MAELDLTNLRRDYSLDSLDETEVAADPFKQFERWFQQAIAAQLTEPYAMTLATADAQGLPSARIVLLRGADARGFTFFTNYNSRKGRDLLENPQAALLFYWAELERQIRIEGYVEQVSPAESDAYFAARPAGNRIAAWASPQSEVIADRTELEQRFGEASDQYGEIVQRPAFWGGYRLSPVIFEFWQGRQSRLHDRIEYYRANDIWQIRRLAP